MKRTPKVTFFIVALLIVALVYTSLFGVYQMYGDRTDTIIKGASDIRFGIDIRGGVDATFKPADDVKDVTDAQIESVKDIIELRLVDNGVTDYEVYADTANQSVIVRFPWKSDETDYNPEAALKEIGQTARLEFHYGDDTKTVTGEDGVEYQAPAGDLVLTGADVDNASYHIDEQNAGAYAVSLSLKSSGREAFATATEKQYASGGTISIWLDHDMISAPRVNAKITDGQAVITGDFDLERASNLANLINAGALDFDIKVDSYSSLSPTLGSSALDAMVLAGIIAFCIIAVYVILYYRLPGFVAVIALAGQVAGSLAAVSGYFPFIGGFTLTLPGIAGIILSVGMGVDANVLTAERIRDEVNLGKTIDGAIHAGCKSSFSAILDGNVTTIIVAIVLMGVFGPPASLWAKILTPFLFMFPTATTGSIYSFGYTLLMGILFNFIMGVWASRLMLQSVTRFKFLRNPWLIGGKRS